jgi:hypothetical protein
MIYHLYGNSMLQISIKFTPVVFNESFHCANLVYDILRQNHYKYMVYFDKVNKIMNWGETTCFYSFCLFCEINEGISLYGIEKKVPN